MVPKVAQPRALFCYVLQQAQPTEMHKFLIQPNLIDDPHMQINELCRTTAFRIQKQASTKDQLGTIPLQAPSKKVGSRVLGSKQQIQNSFAIRPEALRLSHPVVLSASLLPADATRSAILQIVHNAPTLTAK